ncbi:DUF433 domain-containing protein [Duganella vulcania]|uniref:DUF433 domain-containing protein n=1 Tax=Duganella vulcania TaxID=2692166 RepID=A0A845GVE9_9BURK|nr:DUF433 domain-containing protein [Duganella vulcania]
MKPNLNQRITEDAAQCGGRACIRHPRFSDILNPLAAGESHEQILIDHPFLEKDDIYMPRSLIRRS